MLILAELVGLRKDSELPKPPEMTGESLIG